MKTNVQQKLTPALEGLKALELAGITMIRDYLQFLFDGPVFNAYVLPQITIGNNTYKSTDFGYYDVLHSLIGHTVSSAYEDKIEEKIIVRFENDMEFSVSLKEQGKDFLEVAMLYIGEGSEVWS